MRSGHTEAAMRSLSACRHRAVAAICELVNDDGHVMRGPQVSDFASGTG